MFYVLHNRTESESLRRSYESAQMPRATSISSGPTTSSVRPSNGADDRQNRDPHPGGRVRRAPTGMWTVARPVTRAPGWIDSHDARLTGLTPLPTTLTLAAGSFRSFFWGEGIGRIQYRNAEACVHDGWNRRLQPCLIPRPVVFRRPKKVAGAEHDAAADPRPRGSIPSGWPPPPRPASAGAHADRHRDDRSPKNKKTKGSLLRGPGLWAVA
jgi:hypothetical protein